MTTEDPMYADAMVEVRSLRAEARIHAERARRLTATADLAEAAIKAGLLTSCPSCNVALCTGGPQEGTCPKCLCRPARRAEEIGPGASDR